MDLSLLEIILPEGLLSYFDIVAYKESVYLHIKTSRWRDKKTKSKQIRNNYSFIAEGSKLTEELSSFLKATGRDPRRYD